MKTIWIINQYAGSLHHGMEYRHYYLARSLQEKGYEVIIFSGSYSHLYKNQPKVDHPGQEEMIDGIRYVWLQNRYYEKPGSLSRVLNMRDFVSSMKKLDIRKFPKADFILVSSPSLFPVVTAKKWANKLKAKLIFEVRDIWPLTLQYLGGFGYWHPLIIYMRYFENYAYRKSDFVISVLPGLLLHTGKKVDAKKFRCIPNGIFVDEKNQLQESPVKFPEGKFIVTYVGTIGKANALDYLIEAAKLLKEHTDIHFMIVGDGAEKSALEKSAQGLNITFSGPVGKHAVNAVLEKSSCAFIGWHREPLYKYGISANKLYDYLYSGIPVIHSVEAYNDMVKDAGAGISVPPADAKAIADAVVKMKNLSSDQRKQMEKEEKCMS